jgi:hypothetical protein
VAFRIQNNINNSFFLTVGPAFSVWGFLKSFYGADALCSARRSWRFKSEDGKKR